MERIYIEHKAPTVWTAFIHKESWGGDSEFELRFNNENGFIKPMLDDIYMDGVKMNPYEKRHFLNYCHHDIGYIAYFIKKFYVDGPIMKGENNVRK